MLSSLEKLHNLGWRTTKIDKEKGLILLEKYGKKRIGVIKIDIESKQFLCYNKETNYVYDRIDVRDLTLEELVLIYKLLKEWKNENKEKPKNKRRNKKT